MAQGKRLVWDQTGERVYETGTKMGVLFVQDETGAYPKGVAWNGLRSVTESPSGAEATALYANDSKYLELYSNEEFGCTISAYTYPDEFAECDYRTVLGNDTKGEDYGYKLHLVYGAKASPSEKGYSTINDSPEAIEFSWECTTTPVNVEGFKPTSHLEIDSTKVKPDKLKKIEDILYGTNGTGSEGTTKESRLPMPEEIISILKAA